MCGKEGEIKRVTITDHFNIYKGVNQQNKEQILTTFITTTITSIKQNKIRRKTTTKKQPK